MLIPTKVLRDNAQVDNTVKPENQMSAAAVLKARRGIVTGIIRSRCRRPRRSMRTITSG